MKKISLTQGKFAVVDDEDFEEFNKYKWYFNGHYAVRTIKIAKNKRHNIRMHREILNLKNNYFECDHINQNKLDNRKENLRVVTKQQNIMNRKLQKNNTSGYKGVYRVVKKKKDKVYKYWMAKIRYNKKEIYLGFFKTSTEAAIAYNKKALELFKEFACLNRIEEN